MVAVKGQEPAIPVWIHHFLEHANPRIYRSSRMSLGTTLAVLATGFSSLKACRRRVAKGAYSYLAISGIVSVVSVGFSFIVKGNFLKGQWRAMRFHSHKVSRPLYFRFNVAVYCYW